MFHTKIQVFDYQLIMFLIRSVVSLLKNGTNELFKKKKYRMFSNFFRESKNWDTTFVTI
ncbi:hypothetical protein SAMN05192574_103496 [Mucilaginibacter gossypiicola]|uniref:Uncharacterized protein n=1 Tax=Mucilaginibacter gossypiicola TaxID=551995 RepID=A0A1H8HFY1_9SPHI|nr:hypothetical protein SAMN05192574_103496 [Mucilaginibacter gossypiicola]